MGLVRKLNDFLFGTVDVKYFHWFRWLFAGSLLATYLFYLEDPIFFLANYDLAKKSLSLSIFLPLFLWFALLTSLFAIVLGYRTNVFAAISMVLVMLARVFTNFGHWGWSSFSFSVLFLLIFIRIRDRYSVEHLILKKPVQTQFLALPFRLLELLVCLVYFTAVVHRWGDPTWESGEVLISILNSHTFSRVSGFDFSSMTGVLRILGKLSLYLEYLGALIFIFGRFKKWIVIPLILMHVGLNLSSHLGPWQIVMAASLVLILGNQYFPRVNTERVTHLRKMTLALVTIIVVSHFSVNLPFNKIKTSMWKMNYILQGILKIFPTGAVARQRVMHASPPYALCFKIYGEFEDGHKQILREWTPEQCMGNRSYIFIDSIYHGLMTKWFWPTTRKFNDRFLSKELITQSYNEERRNVSNRLGYASCKSFNKPLLNNILIVSFQLEPVGKGVDTFHRTIAYYSCKTDKTIPDEDWGNKKDFLDLEMENYKQYFFRKRAGE